MKKWRVLTAVGSCVLLSGLVSACGGAALGGSGEGGSDGTIKIGLLVAQSGVYSAAGLDMQKGFELYLEEHGGKLGGHEVEVVTVDEGQDPQTGVAAATRLVQQERVDAVVGIVTGPTAMGSRDIFDGAQVPVILGNTGSVALGAELKSKWIFRGAADNRDPGRRLGAYLAQDESAGDVYLMAADYSGGHETIAGFKETFPADRIVGEVYAPFGTTSDYSPYLAKARSSGAKTVFAFFAGAEALAFTKQFHQFGLSNSMQLYGAGFLTEGTLLEAEGQAAIGVRNASRYNWDLDTELNAEFVQSYQKKYDALPTVYAATMYDTGIMLDRAIGSIEGDVTNTGLRDAVAQLSAVEGVRGELEFDDNNTMKEPFYLVEAKETPDGLRNVTIGELGRN